MDISIKKAERYDYAELSSIEENAALSFLDVGYDFCANGAVRDEEEFDKGLRDGALFLAEHQGRTVGSALMWRVDGNAHLTELAVLQDFQKKGVGSALLNAAENWAREEGYKAITLTTFLNVPWNAPAYRKRGFREFIPGQDQPELLAIQEEEKEAGFAVEPRSAMIKEL